MPPACLSGSDSSLCPFGSDCHDCGVRTAGDECENGTVNICRDDGENCAFVRDGTCDDGGEGARERDRPYTTYMA